jgi:hypothetical protein
MRLDELPTSDRIENRRGIPGDRARRTSRMAPQRNVPDGSRLA